MEDNTKLANAIDEFMDMEYDTMFGRIKMKDLQFFSDVLDLSVDHDSTMSRIPPRFIVDVVRLHRKYMDG